MEPEPQDEVELQDSPIPEGEHLADVGMEMERQKLLEEKKRLEANLAQVLWEDGQEPSEDDVLSWKMRLREIELELDGKSTITRFTTIMLPCTITAALPPPRTRSLVPRTAAQPLRDTLRIQDN